jgi:hypothetical protein
MIINFLLLILTCASFIYAQPSSDSTSEDIGVKHSTAITFSMIAGLSTGIGTLKNEEKANNKVVSS